MEESDEALIGRYARGDAAAFDQLYKRHELRVWRYLACNLGNPATADELLLEVWCALARNTASVESTTRVKSRLFTLAHDRMTQWLEAQGEPTSSEAGADLPAAAGDPAKALAQAVAQLPREQREAYLLQIEGQLSVGEIAAIAGSTIDANKGHLRLARVKLRELLSEAT
jgi:DNA-directed RNA polymerase specialized sigma24 family protein